MFAAFDALHPGIHHLASAKTDVNSRSILGLGLSSSAEEASGRRRESTDRKVIQLYDATRPQLYRYLISTGLRPHDVEELVQETFLRLYRHLRAGGSEGNLRSWIFQVAHNLSTNLRKSRRRVVETTPEMWERFTDSVVDKSAGPEDQLLGKERLLRIHESLQKLTQLQRDCLFLRTEGFRYREIGELLSVSTSTVSGSLRNAINILTKVGI
jgi:RNA polymerase sigma-70 factor (ECF subfamily)